MTELLTGTVTFLFTDIEGSTQLLKRLGKQYGEVLADHRTILRGAVGEHGGVEVDNQGDSFLFAFPRADEAAAAAIDAQRELAVHEWPAGGHLGVRMGIHTAEPSLTDEGYYGLGVHRAARIMGAAHGGQVLVSLAASSVLEDAELPGGRLRDLGEHWLKDLDRPERIYQLDVAGLKSVFPPVRATQRPGSGAEPAPADAAEVLLERSDALSILAGSLDAVVSTGRGQLVLVSGEAGVGKTSLLHRFCDDNLRSARILWGSCDPLFTPRPLGPLVDVADLVAGELAEVVEEGGQPQAVATALMRELGSREATVLVLDDVHWADEATLDVIALLGRRLDAVPALVLLSYRDDELDRSHPLRLLLGALATARSVRRLEVSPLSRDAIAELAEPLGVDADALFAKTAGNPFFASEMLAAGEKQLPQTVRDAVLARAARLGESGTAVLEAVAVAPPQVELWLLEALVERDVDGLSECLSSGMVTHSTAGVSFRHELARLAFEDSLPPDRRLMLHRIALVALESPPTGTPDLERLAHHADAAGDGVAVLRYAPTAGARAAALGAHREAAAQYTRALRFADGLPPSERADLLERLSRECYLTDQPDEAIESLWSAVECYKELGDVRKEGDSLRKLGNISWCPGRTAQAGEAVQAAIEVLEPLPASRELAGAYAVMAQLRKDFDDLDGALAWGTRALKLAQSVDDTTTAAHALNTIGTAELLAGIPSGQEKLECSLALAESEGLVDHIGRAFVHFVQVGARLRSYALADRYLERGLAYTGERGLDLWFFYLFAFRARIELDRGRWREAVESATLVFQKPVISTLPRIFAYVVLGLVQARRGEPDALTPLDRALELAEPTRELPRIAPAAAARAEAAWLARDPEGVDRATSGALELALERGSAWPIGELAYWRWRAGLDFDLPPGAAEPYAVQIAGDWQRAAELWSEIGCPYEAALALTDADDESAIRRGLDELRRMGATSAATILTSRLEESPGR